MKQKICAIIIARLTSSRLPNKQLRKIAGKPLMYHIIQRLKIVKNIDKILLATASQKENGELADYVKRFDIETFFYDNENDVIGRIVKAGISCKADVIVTISGDCPLIDPDFIEKAVSGLLASNADYIFIDNPKTKCIHEGIGVKTLDTWKKLEELSTTDSLKEYAGAVLNDYKHLFRGQRIAVEKIFQRKDFRISVDTPADIEFMDEIFSEFSEEGSTFRLSKVMNLIDQKPWLKLLNAHVHQKAVGEISPSILLITHANEIVGMGHLSRSISLARELKEAKAAKVVFCIEANDYSISLVEKNGFYYHRWNNFEELKNLIVNLKDENEKIDSIIVDLKPSFLESFLFPLEKTGKAVVLVDYLHQHPRFFNIIPSAYINNNLQKKIENNSQVLAGKDYLIIRREIIYWRQNDSIKADGIVVASGGSGALPDEMLINLSKLSERYKIKFIIGPYANLDIIKTQIKKYPFQKYEILHNPEDPFQVYKSSQLAIATFGVTVYELLALGIPTIIVKTLHEKDSNLVEYLAKKNICIDIVNDQVSSEKFIKLVVDLMNSQEKRDEIGRLSQNFIDGLGVSKIVKEMFKENI